MTNSNSAIISTPKNETKMSGEQRSLGKSKLIPDYINLHLDSNSFFLNDFGMIKQVSQVKSKRHPIKIQANLTN